MDSNVHTHKYLFKKTTTIHSLTLRASACTAHRRGQTIADSRDWLFCSVMYSPVWLRYWLHCVCSTLYACEMVSAV